MNKQRKDTIRAITERFELFGTPTVTALWEFVLLDDYCGGRDSDSIAQALKQIGEQVRKERYDKDVCLSAIRSLQGENEKLRQLSLFPGTIF